MRQMMYLIYLVTIIGIFLVNPLLSEHLLQPKSTESINDSQNIDKNILIELFETTNGYNWTRNDGWLMSNISYCQWYGVICDSNSNVGSLSLHENHLFGSLPDSIGNLQSIRLLDLGSNLLTGTIPESIGQLARVQYLAFDSNQLSGSIPSSIGRMVVLGTW
jgi:Leucine-rich repeat (LRR) protein